jgi:hypothetical protein
VAWVKVTVKRLYVDIEKTDTVAWRASKLSETKTEYEVMARPGRKGGDRGGRYCPRRLRGKFAREKKPTRQKGAIEC